MTTADAGRHKARRRPRPKVAKHRAEVLDQRAAESFEARKGRDECPPKRPRDPNQLAKSIIDIRERPMHRVAFSRV